VANVDTLKSDPELGNAKHLKIVYRKNEKETTLWFDEPRTVNPRQFE
jgi:hypothetical protein